jgi:hypothetical protein
MCTGTKLEPSYKAQKQDLSLKKKIVSYVSFTVEPYHPVFLNTYQQKAGENARTMHSSSFHMMICSSVTKFKHINKFTFYPKIKKVKEKKTEIFSDSLITCPVARLII